MTDAHSRQVAGFSSARLFMNLHQRSFEHILSNTYKLSDNSGMRHTRQVKAEMPADIHQRGLSEEEAPALAAELLCFCTADILQSSPQQQLQELAGISQITVLASSVQGLPLLPLDSGRIVELGKARCLVANNKEKVSFIVMVGS